MSTHPIETKCLIEVADDIKDRLMAIIHTEFVPSVLHVLPWPSIPKIEPSQRR